MHYLLTMLVFTPSSYVHTHSSDITDFNPVLTQKYQFSNQTNVSECILTINHMLN